MLQTITITNYSERNTRRVRALLNNYLQGTWMDEYIDGIYQICDELIKNALKSNYKFMLIWERCRHRLMKHHPEFTEEEADSWLSEIFYSGESNLIAKQLEKLPDRDQISGQVRKLLDAESQSMRRKKNQPPGVRKLPPEFQDLLHVRELSRSLNVHVHFRIDNTGDQIFITTENDSPILEEDFVRINQVRYKFKNYYLEGRQEQFFVDNLDTSGGGHGLGYAIMDAILLEMKLDPEICLYLISASRTMVLLVLPLTSPQV